MSKGNRNRTNRKNNNKRMMTQYLTGEQMARLDALLAERMKLAGVPFFITHVYGDATMTTVFDN